MLMPHEENFVKRFIRENTSRFRQAAPTPPQASLSLEDLTTRELSRGRMQTLNLNDDPLVRSKLFSAGYRTAEPGQIFSLGISREKILNSTARELRAAIEQAREQAREQGAIEPKQQAFSIPAGQPAAVLPPHSARVGRNFAIEVG
jgi:hypothetical protein